MMSGIIFVLKVVGFLIALCVLFCCFIKAKPNILFKGIKGSQGEKAEDKPEKPLCYKRCTFCEINGCTLEQLYEFQDYQDIGICDEIGEGKAFKYSFIQPVPFTVSEEIEKELKYNNKIHLKHYFNYGDGTEREIVFDKDVYFVRKYDYLKGFGNMLDPIVRYGEEIVEPYMGSAVHILVLIFSLEELPPYEEKKRLEAEYKNKRLEYVKRRNENEWKEKVSQKMSRIFSDFAEADLNELSDLAWYKHCEMLDKKLNAKCRKD